LRGVEAGGIYRLFRYRGGNSVRSIITGAAVLLSAAVGAVSAQAAPQAAPGPDVSQIMVIIAVAPSSTNGVQMTYLTFPSERACLAAAEVFTKPVDHVTVVARCAPAK
jgi:predicted permease